MPTPALDPKLLNDGLYIVAYIFYKHTLCFSVQEQFSTKKKDRNTPRKHQVFFFFGGGGGGVLFGPDMVTIWTIIL